MLRPKALDHVGLAVTDMDRSLRFYCGTLGLELLRRSDKGDVGSAVLRIGDQEINIFCNPQFVPSEKDSGHSLIDHCCLEIDSATIEEVVEALWQSDVEIAKGPVKP
jgi:catechol 2,3-dioxygenase-like lactoylglutathione lyase family enzyme